ncbi:hypothetical protein KY362_00170, partial [Candidatus Woesearchaeota archaeon]|nr:hypothetical protein [Candidatus Woesearchaeota archaeon]
MSQKNIKVSVSPAQYMATIDEIMEKHAARYESMIMLMDLAGFDFQQRMIIEARGGDYSDHDAAILSIILNELYVNARKAIYKTEVHPHLAE